MSAQLSRRREKGTRDAIGSGHKEEWTLMRVISGHTGAIRSLSVDPTNDWLVTGSTDRTLKIWSLGTGQLRLTLTGHVGGVRCVEVSEKHPYVFSAGDDKQVKCWDLEQNRVVRHFHGHLSGVYALSAHPTLDGVLVSAGRDAAVRVWDLRTRAAIHTLTGHKQTVNGLLTTPCKPHIISASSDTTIRLWDIGEGACLSTLTHNKKSVRALAASEEEWTFVSGGAGAIKRFLLPAGQYIQDYGLVHGEEARSGGQSPTAQEMTIVNCMATSKDTLVSGTSAGNLIFHTNYTTASSNDGKIYANDNTAPTQIIQSKVQPGSLACDNAIYCCKFDKSGTRLFTGEGDKSLKVWGRVGDEGAESEQ